MPENINNKTRMYELLKSGDLGNTMQYWDSLEEWDNDPETLKYKLFGVRSPIAQDKRMQLDLDDHGVIDFVTQHFPDGKCNISPMVDHWATFRGELWDSPTGFRLFGADIRICPRVIKWREMIRNFCREFTGLEARCILQHYMNLHTYNDLLQVLDRFPGHVVEFTTLDRCRGKIPGRNAVIWEVRNY